MRPKLDMFLNLGLVLALSVMGLVLQGPSYLIYLAGAAGIYFVVSGWRRSREHAQATADQEGHGVGSKGSKSTSGRAGGSRRGGKGKRV